MQWAEIYRRLKKDRDDATAWLALKRGSEFMAKQSWKEIDLAILEDIGAETCERVVFHLDAAHGPDTFSAFVYGHMRNVRRDVLKRWKDVVPLDSIVELADVRATGLLTEDRIVLEDCFHKLQLRDQVAVRMRHLRNHRVSEIAAVLGISESNVRTLIHRALKQLRECLKDKIAGQVDAGHTC